MNLYLLRHTSVEKKYQKCYNGSFDVDIDLDFIKTQKFIDRKKELEKIDFDSIYSSKLQRSIKTLEHLDYINFIQTPLINEVSFKFEGQNFNDFKHLAPPNAMSSTKNWCDFILNESIDNFRARAKSFLDSLNGKNILICSHLGAIAMMLSIIQKRDFYEVFDEAVKIEYLDLIKINSLKL